MTDKGLSESYEINIRYTDAGMSIEFDIQEWREKLADNFGSFESIKKFYQTDPDELMDQYAEGLEEIGPDESPSEPGVVFNNPPKEWKEDRNKATPYLRLVHQLMVQMGLGILMEREIDDQQRLIEQESYKPLIIRQSAFYEDYLVYRSLLSLQELKNGTLSKKELQIVEQMGHRDRVRLAHLLGELDEQGHGLLQEMARWRNDIAHQAWSEFDSQEESQIESVGKRVYSRLKSQFEQAKTEEEEIANSDDSFDIGFHGLDADTQNLQLTILDILRTRGGSTEVADIVRIHPGPEEKVRQRILRMDHIGYVSFDKESTIVEIEPNGRTLLEDEF